LSQENITYGLERRSILWVRAVEQDMVGGKGGLVALKILILTICVALFTYQMSFIWEQYRNEETSIAMQNLPNLGLRLPAATVCAR
jgi:hypothetical protein